MRTEKKASVEGKAEEEEEEEEEEEDEEEESEEATAKLKFRFRSFRACSTSRTGAESERVEASERVRGLQESDTFLRVVTH